MKLLTFSMGMIQTDDFLIRVTKVRPPCFNFNIRNKIELTIFINGSFRNLVAGTECKLFIELLTGNGFPVTAYINRFPSLGLFTFWKYCFAISNQSSVLSRRRFRLIMKKQPVSIRTATLSMESLPESRRINSGLSVSL